MLVGITLPPRESGPGHGLDLRAVRDLTLLAQSVVSGVKLRAMLYYVVPRTATATVKQRPAWQQALQSQIDNQAPPTL